MKLRPYHNPKNVDESKVPSEWRFRYADEKPTPTQSLCRTWDTETQQFGGYELFISGQYPQETQIVKVGIQEGPYFCA